MTECLVNECDLPVYARMSRRGLCVGHYGQWRRKEKYRPIQKQMKGGASGECSEDTCIRPRYAKGLCRNHYNRARRAAKDPCSIEGCDRPPDNRGLCHTHWRRDQEGRPGGEIKSAPEDPAYRYKHKGYVRIYRPDHPNAWKSGWIQEHMVVMSAMIGRPLLPGENVHHKNGVKDDNRPENLELWITSQPLGQRPQDLVAWANMILERYSDMV